MKNAEMQGIKIRSRVQDFEKGERCTSYFIQNEKELNKKKELAVLIEEETNEEKWKRKISRKLW